MQTVGFERSFAGGSAKSSGDRMSELNMNALRLFLFLAMTMPVGLHAQEEAGEQSEIVETCIQAQEPGVCLKSYGYVCHQRRSFSRSLEAYRLSCNLALPGGRYHFVQALYDDGGWTVENQHTYLPEQDEIRTEAEDSGLALSAYVSEQMKNYSVHSSMTGSSEYIDGRLDIITGTRRQGEQIAVRAVCGVVLDGQLSETVSMRTRAECEKYMLRTIMKVSQPQSASPYRAAGADEVEWNSKTAVLVSSDIAFIVDGRYTFTQEHTPCLWISGCCSTDGSIYLDSCRVPTEAELQAVKSCLSQGLQPRSEDFFACMREANVKIGCDEQADGSRVCY